MSKVSLDSHGRTWNVPVSHRASLKKSGWANAYWGEIRPRCASDSHAYRCLANRWLAIIWRLWQDRKPYNEQYHLQQRVRRRRPKL